MTALLPAWPAVAASALPALLLLAVLAAAVQLWRVDRRRGRQAEAALLLHWHGWLMRRFGLPSDGAPPTASFVGVLHSHRVLRQTLTMLPPSREDPRYRLRADVLLQDEQREFWLVLFENAIGARQLAAGAADLAQPPAVLRIGELRARRALFNDPPAYQRAFGEAPTRQALAAWRQRHPEQEPPDSRF